mmetsp:Transcript_158691/g.280299  ORF Transcript_158691/g.280299 Transcript_158691/m.280299 type:complete len:244 (+) Transcript_158691:169-900(+)
MDDWEGDSENDCLVSDRDRDGRQVGGSRSRGVHGSSASGALGRFTAKVWSLLPPQLRAVNMDLLQGAVVRLYYSKFTAVLYLGTLVFAGILLAITLGLDTPLRDAPRALLILEAVVSLSLLMEVVMRAVVLGRSYLQSYANILDGLVAFASASLLFWAAPRASASQEYERQKEDVELSQSLVMARTLVQFGRVLLIAEHARRSRQAKSADDISFAALSADFDFSALCEPQLQEKHREEDYPGL